MSEANVAILEHTDFRTATKVVRKVMSALGHDISVTELRPGASTLEGPRSIFSQRAIDIFISDLSLGKTSSSNYEGLHYIQNVKKNYPDIYVIGISQGDLSYYTSASNLPTFDLFVQKDLVDDSRYMGHLIETIRANFRRNVSVSLDLEQSILQPSHKSPLWKVKLERILRGVTFTSHSPTPATNVARVVLTPLDDGRSTSDVYRMYAYTEAGLQCINAVLKLSPRVRAAQEIDNYLNYVKWYLPYTWRVEQLGTIMLADIGAICYSFAYNDDRPFRSAAKYMNDGKFDELQSVIDKIFRPTFQRWYHQNNVMLESADLKGYYQQRWFEAKGDGEEVLRKTLRNFDQSERNNVLIDNVRYAMPRGYLLGSPWGEYYSCIRHGDLHGGNILLSDAQDLAFIDFQQTGRGHVFEDFVTFEASLRFNHVSDLSFEELLLAEHAELSHGASSLPHGRLIRSIRTYARENFPGENFLSYVFALGLYCYRLLRVKDVGEAPLNQLVACTLACVRYLKEVR